jgi:hypothetical protein
MCKLKGDLGLAYTAQPNKCGSSAIEIGKKKSLKLSDDAFASYEVLVSREWQIMRPRLFSSLN